MADSDAKQKRLKMQHYSEHVCLKICEKLEIPPGSAR